MPDKTLSPGMYRLPSLTLLFTPFTETDAHKTSKVRSFWRLLSRDFRAKYARKHFAEATVNSNPLTAFHGLGLCWQMDVVPEVSHSSTKRIHSPNHWKTYIIRSWYNHSANAEWQYSWRCITASHGLHIKCLLRWRLMFCAHGIMLWETSNKKESPYDWIQTCRT